MAGFSFNLGDIFGGLKNGITRGLQLDVDFVKLELKAYETGDKILQNDLTVVRNMWLKEVADSSGIVRGNIVGAILGGGDPFAGSRHAFQQVKAKHGVK